MCVNYVPVKRQGLEHFEVPPPEGDWPDEVWQDYAAPIIVGTETGARRALLGSYGMIPQRRYRTPAEKRNTVNARAETIGEKTAFASAWRASQLCLVPLECFFEPKYLTEKKSFRWGIGMADGAPFAVAGLWRAWEEPEGRLSHSFTQITVNADAHPLMGQFHKWGDEKRSLVVLPRESYDDWLQCRNPERARSFLNLYPAELMTAWPAPKEPPVSAQQDLFL
jgi:putative SOS response-associated peptidase YedK